MRHTTSGQALIELVLVLPLLAEVVLGGLILCRLAISQADVQLAAVIGADSPDAAGAARVQLGRNRLVDPGQTMVQVRRVGQLRLVTVTSTVSAAWWPGGTVPRLKLSAVAGRGRAVLCTRARR
ncbi:MAG: hypothetical protein ACM3XZ_00560 [Betaproteobacteria bacterium]